MAKKKVLTETSADSPVGNDVEYEVNVWAGSPHYNCKLCQFDTLIGLATILTHLVERHSSEKALEALFPRSPTVTAPVYQIDGSNQIVEVTDGTNNPE